MEKYCDAKGMKCCQSVNIDRKKCLKPCFGVYADVSKNLDDYEKMKDSWNLIIEKYKIFKNMFLKNISYPPELIGMQFLFP